MKRKLLIAFGLLVVIACTALFLYVKTANAPDGPNHAGKNSRQQPAFDKKQYSLVEPASPWVIVNKKRSLPSDYIPNNLVSAGSGEQLRSDAAEVLNNLLAAGKSQGINLSVLSGYRSYTRQTSVYNSYVSKDGRAQADTYSARPGHSEHQTGLAVDLGSGVCNLETCFGDTPAGKWLADSAYKYGFVIRYLKGKENVTGYQYEPWHLRYVGKELAAELYKTGQTMEEFFGLPAASAY